MNELHASPLVPALVILYDPISILFSFILTNIFFRTIHLLLYSFVGVNLTERFLKLIFFFILMHSIILQKFYLFPLYSDLVCMSKIEPQDLTRFVSFRLKNDIIYSVLNKIQVKNVNLTKKLIFLDKYFISKIIQTQEGLFDVIFLKMNFVKVIFLENK